MDTVENLKPEAKCAAEDSMNEAILDLFEVAEDVEEFSLAVCW